MTQKLKRQLQAIEILTAIGVPMNVNSEVRALVFLALLDITADTEIPDAKTPLIGITPIIDFINAHYRNEGNPYKPNTRENIRDEAVQYFVEAGIVVPNPDKPSRPKNSPAFCYQISPEFLDLIKTFDSSQWEETLQSYKGLRPSLIDKYARIRDQLKVPIAVRAGREIKLSPGPHSELMKEIVEQFGPRFAPGSHLLYVGDTGDKYSFLDEEWAEKIGFRMQQGTKIPDVILFDSEKKWLYLIESVTSNGPIDGKRYDELQRIFGSLGIGIIYVTAFPNRSIMASHIAVLMWDTEVWIADSPSHLIHLNGDRFLGPRS